MRAKAEEQQMAFADCKWLSDSQTRCIISRHYSSSSLLCCERRIVHDRNYSMFDGSAEEDFPSTVILTPTNDDSLTINGHVLETLRGQPVNYFSTDVERDN